MNEWIEDLERIKKLLDDGALTTEEYERQKARILMESAASAIESEKHHEDEKRKNVSHNSRQLWFMLGVGVFCLGLVGAYVIWEPPDQKNTAQLVQADRLEPIDLSPTLQFASPSECLATGHLEQIQKGLENALKTSPEGMPITLDGLEGLDEGLRILVSSKYLEKGWQEKAASVRFPEESLWNGLRINEVKLIHFIPPDVGGISVTQSLTFLDTPQEVKRVLNKLGFPAPISPETYQISEDCSQEMQIESQPSGAALSCSYWC
jgi:hypothetical protein